MPKKINGGLKECGRPPTYLHVHCHRLGPGCHGVSPGQLQHLPERFPWVHSNVPGSIPSMAEAFSGHLKSPSDIALLTKNSFTVSYCAWLKSRFLSVVYRALCDPTLGQRKITWEMLWYPCGRHGRKDGERWPGEMFRKRKPPEFWPWLCCWSVPPEPRFPQSYGDGR